MSERRTRKILISIGPEDYERIKAVARAEYQTPTSFARAATMFAVDARETRRMAHAEKEGIGKLAGVH